MYPYQLFWGLDLYSILIVVGVIACMALIRVLGDKKKYEAKYQNFLLLNTLIAIFGGYGLAVVTQAFYNIAALGKFELSNNTGSTFYGGLVGGIALFILVYFGAGHFIFYDGYHKKHFREISDLAGGCIAVAHGFGRLGCLMAGCCHGAVTDKWYGIYMVSMGKKVVPVQLFEALFLFALGAVLIWMFVKNKRYVLPTYLFSYGIWRFFIEYLRDDERGQTIVKFLSPSQLTSLLLMTAAIIILSIEFYVDDRKKPTEQTDESVEADDGEDESEEDEEEYEEADEDLADESVDDEDAEEESADDISEGNEE